MGTQPTLMVADGLCVAVAVRLVPDGAFLLPTISEEGSGGEGKAERDRESESDQGSD